MFYCLKLITAALLAGTLITKLTPETVYCCGEDVNVPSLFTALPPKVVPVVEIIVGAINCDTVIAVIVFLRFMVNDKFAEFSLLMIVTTVLLFVVEQAYAV